MMTNVNLNNVPTGSGLYTAFSVSATPEEKMSSGKLQKCMNTTVEEGHAGTEYGGKRTNHASTDSLSSSMCLTEAVQTMTTQAMSSTINASLFLQGSQSVPRAIWEMSPVNTNEKSISDDLLIGSAFKFMTIPENSDNSTGLWGPKLPTDSTDELDIWNWKSKNNVPGLDILENRSNGTKGENASNPLSMSSNTTPPHEAPVCVKPQKVMDLVEETMPVLDPQRSKLHIPLSAIIPTKALGGRVRHPSLCLLYQSGRCRQGSNCYQVHVDPSMVQRLRRIVENLPCCCTLHGDCNTKMWNAEAYKNRGITVSGVTVLLQRVAYTSGLSRLLSSEQCVLNPAALCRLHGKPNGCRYGADCWYVHVCREVLNTDLAYVMEMNTAVAAAAAASAASESVHKPQTPNKGADYPRMGRPPQSYHISPLPNDGHPPVMVMSSPVAVGVRAAATVGGAAGMTAWNGRAPSESVPVVRPVTNMSPATDPFFAAVPLTLPPEGMRGASGAGLRATAAFVLPMESTAMRSPMAPSLQPAPVTNYLVLNPQPNGGEGETAYTAVWHPQTVPQVNALAQVWEEKPSALMANSHTGREMYAWGGSTNPTPQQPRSGNQKRRKNDTEVTIHPLMLYSP